jgi:hypothetical protein
MNEEPRAARPQPLRLATLLMAAAVMVGGTGCITTSLIDSAQRASRERARKARDAEIVQRAEQKKRAEFPAQPQ